jgi:MFS family permease
MRLHQHMTEKNNQIPTKAAYLITTAALFWASLYTYPSILSPYLNNLRVSLPATGLVLGSYGLTQTVLRLPAGILSDRWRNKKVFIIGGLILSLISAAGLFYFQNVWMILFFRGLAGAAAAVWVHFTTLYLSYYSAGSSASAMGKLSSSISLAQMAAIIGGSYLAQYLGWRYAFLLAFVLAVPGLAFSLKITEKRAEPSQVLSFDHQITVGNILKIGRNRLLFWTSILGLLSQLVIFASTQGFVPQYASELGASKAAIGWLTALSILPRALAAILGGSLLARWFKLRSLVMLGFLLIGVATCLLPLINNLELLFVSQFISGIGAGFTSTILLALCTQTVQDDFKSSAMGYFQAVYGIGMVIGPTLVGFLAGIFNLGTGFVVVGAISLLSSVLTLLVI